jgi:hypothetical protein
MLMATDEGLVDSESFQKKAGVSGVLAGDEIHLPERYNGSWREFGKVSDRRRDKVKQGLASAEIELAFNHVF